MTAARPRWILALATTVITVLCLEAIGRWVVPSPPPRQDGLVADAQLGWTLPAGTTLSWRGQPVRVNRLGLRGLEPQDSTSTTKVLIVGDSSVFGDGVRDNETLAVQLAQALPTGFEVQNGGVPGYTCPQTRVLFERIRTAFSPDVLVIYNMHSDYRLAGSQDRVISENQLGPLQNTGIGRLVATGTLWYRIARERPNLNVGAYQDCLAALAEKQLTTGRKTVFVWPVIGADFPDHALYQKPDPSPPGLRISDYRAAMKQAATQTGSTLVDGPKALVSIGLTSQTALIDLVHPTARGHQGLAHAIARAIAPSD